MGPKKKEPFTLTPRLKSKAPGLVVYEIQMFLDLLRAWHVDLGILHPFLRVLLENARLEATLVHARILLDFFERTTADRQDDDIVSEDMGFPGKRIKRSRSLKNAINKRLAHLTYTRAKFQNTKRKPWSSDVFHPLVQRCCEFFNADTPNALVAKHTSSKDQAVWNDLKTQAV